MKRVSVLNWIRVLGLILFSIPLVFGCSKTPRQQCYEETYCNSADLDCLAGAFFLSSLLAPSPATTSYYSNESEPNDSFSSADYWLSSGTVYMTGSISGAADDDVFYGYNYSSSGAAIFTISKTSGAATCTAYTRSSVFLDATDPPNIAGGAFTTVGVLSATDTSVSLGYGYYLYVVCQGSASQTYTLKGVAPTATYGGLAASLQTIMALSCVGASNVCKKECNDKHAF